LRIAGPGFATNMTFRVGPHCAIMVAKDELKTMIPSLVLIVAAYVAFRCIETFCKRRDGQYSQVGFGVVILAAAGTLLVAAFVSFDVVLNAVPSSTANVAPLEDKGSAAERAKSVRETEELMRRTREIMKK